MIRHRLNDRGQQQKQQQQRLQERQQNHRMVCVLQVLKEVWIITAWR